MIENQAIYNKEDVPVPHGDEGSPDMNIRMLSNDSPPDWTVLFPLFHRTDDPLYCFIL
jgi:hypothetical protein